MLFLCYHLSGKLKVPGAFVADMCIGGFMFRSKSGEKRSTQPIMDVLWLCFFSGNPNCSVSGKLP